MEQIAVADAEVSFAPGRPPVIAVPVPDPALAWLSAHRPQLRALAGRYGAVLVRGLGIADPAAAAAASRSLLDRLMVEREPFAPRRALTGGVYSSVAWPPDQPMCMHHELSYLSAPPGFLVFACLAAPERGGATALADAAAVLRDLPAELVAQFEVAGWELRRVHNDVVGVPWPEAFGTASRAEVEAYCRQQQVSWRWAADDSLHTSRRRPAIRTHPASGERVWCNQVAFLNEWTMEPAVREYLVAEFGTAGLPYTTATGDGEPLDAATVDLINEVYDAHTVREPWQAGDLMLVDNLRTAHNREPYQGEREIVVAMGDPVPTLAP